MHRVVVVGGSLAGLNAVQELRHRGFQGELTLVSAERTLPYDRPPLSKAALRDGAELEKLLLKSPAWYDEQAVDVVLGVPAVGLDTRHKAVSLADGRSLDYDGLVIASGCSPRTLSGFADQATIHLLRSLADATALHDRLIPGRHLVVLGAGFIGLEVAATARSMGLDVTIVEVAALPLTRVLGGEAGRWLHDLHADRGVALHCGTTVVGMQTDRGGTKVTLSDGTVLGADVVVAGLGVAPATQWLEGSGLALAGGVSCDRTLRTSAPDVVAAGDVTRWHHDLFNESMRVEQWLNAVDQGAHAARTLLGEGEPYVGVPYFWSDQFDAKIRFVGRADASDQVEVRRLSDRSLVALFGSAGCLRGALCVNAMRQLVRLKEAIQQRAGWQESLDILG